MNATKTFETVSFHIVKPCDMKCKFCYATFNDMRVERQLSMQDSFTILNKLKAAGVEKVTFAGGEPLLYRWIYEVIVYAKNIGFTTSLITNGSMLTDELLSRFKGQLDWIGISIDSLNPETNSKIGRMSKKTTDYHQLISKIKSLGFKLKINTVVNRYNEGESMQEFITMANPARWKVFDTLRVDGQNETQFEAIKTSRGGFQNFIKRHTHSSMVCEDNEAMTGSYLLVDPQGRLFENSKGKHTYSSPLQHNDIETCLSQINLDRDMFIKRGGIYDW